MPRRRVAAKRRILPDPVFNDTTVAKLINDLMYGGERAIAEKIVYGAFELMESRAKEDPVKVFRKAIENVQPLVEVKSRRVGGSTYQVPIEVRADRRLALALRWIIGAARSRGGKTITDRLANELIDAAANRGTAVKKREDVHKMADANRAFAHYRW
ncbi:MAG: 30S ribosomal protein S7 [Myxococcota bacterium]